VPADRVRDGGRGGSTGAGDGPRDRLAAMRGDHLSVTTVCGLLALIVAALALMALIGGA
jgi:hypothetical protein